MIHFCIDNKQKHGRRERKKRRGAERLILPTHFSVNYDVQQHRNMLIYYFMLCDGFKK
jgi:hypothetical protein